MVSPERTPPRIRDLIAALDRHGVWFVVFGSAGACLYGADLSPGDLDICPALDRVNLIRLASALSELQARPRIIEGWMTDEESLTWRPDPLVESQFDHLFQTSLGDLDVVPRPYGPHGTSDRFEFDSLVDRADSVRVGSVDVRVAAVEDLVASKMSRRRTKDIEAMPELNRIQRRDTSG
jgi:hypothetical protein